MRVLDGDDPEAVSESRWRAHGEAAIVRYLYARAVTNLEIERKFLVTDFESVWGSHGVPDADGGTVMSQGYLVEHALRSLRVRLTRDSASLALKGPREGALRIEYEEPISLELGEQLLHLAEPNVVSKIRFPLVAEGRLWVIDNFLDHNSGLTIAEVELTSLTEHVVVPSWCSTEVTTDERYYNEYLARNPYVTW